MRSRDDARHVAGSGPALAAIDLLIAFILTREENIPVGLRRPLRIKRSADLDVTDKNLEGFFSTPRSGDISNRQELIPSWKFRGEFPERVTLDISQGDMEVNPLWFIRRRGNGKILLADHLGEIRVITGMRTEDQSQPGMLIRIHVAAPGTNANTHDPLVRQETIQVQLQLIGPGKRQDHRRNRRHLPHDSIRPGIRLARGEMNALTRFQVQQMLPFSVVAVILISLIK